MAAPLPPPLLPGTKPAWKRRCLEKARTHGQVQHIYIYIYTYICTVTICLSIYLSIYLSISLYIYIYIYIYVYMHMYTDPIPITMYITLTLSACKHMADLARGTCSSANVLVSSCLVPSERDSLLTPTQNPEGIY